MRRNAPPSRNPIVGGIHRVTPWASAISIDGASSDQKLAAIMTPAAKPIIESRRRWLTLRVTNTIEAPRAVTIQVNPPARRDWTTGERPSNHGARPPSIRGGTVRATA